MDKVKVLIVNDDIKNIKKCIESLNYVNIVGSIDRGEEVYNNIIKLKPDIVFTKFKMHNYNSEDIIKKTFKELRDEKPIFKFVSNDITGDTNTTMYKSKIRKVENNEKIKVARFNYVKELGEKEIVDCLEEYYKEKRNQ